MDLTALLDLLGEGRVGALLGLLTGIVFGIAAQRSSFCLRAATVEFARGRLGPRLSVWLLTFSTAVVWVQAAEAIGLFRSGDARIMAITGSWSGAIVGGLTFGAGMVLARGCSGRLLVLAATGNLRSVMSGLIFAVVAQMSLSGWLSPVRQAIAGAWTTPAGTNIDLLAALHLPHGTGLAAGAALAVVALVLARRNAIAPSRIVFASGVGFAVALGWVATFTLSQQAFDPVTVTSATFSGPSAKSLMFFLVPAPDFDFDIGLVPGVFIGAFAAAAWAGELKLQGFDG